MREEFRFICPVLFGCHARGRKDFLIPLITIVASAERNDIEQSKEKMEQRGYLPA